MKIFLTLIIILILILMMTMDLAKMKKWKKSSIKKKDKMAKKRNRNKEKIEDNDFDSLSSESGANENDKKKPEISGERKKFAKRGLNLTDNLLGPLPPPLPKPKEYIAEIGQSTICATFTISRPCTINSDNKTHKVTIALIPLVTDFVTL